MQKLLLPFIFILAYQAHGANSCEGKASLSAAELIKCTSASSAFQHLQMLQSIAVANNNNRATGTKGYDQSAQYVSGLMSAAGYKVTQNNFSFDKYTKLSSAFEQSLPESKSFVESTDYNVMTYSGSGTAMGPAYAVDLQLGDANQSSSGCEIDDFAAMPAGSIALIQRGTCAFKDKAVNAQNAGAAGVIIFNQGDSADRKDLYQGTLSNEAKLSIPVLATTYDLGVALQNATITFQAETKVELMTSYNIIAEHPFGNSDNIVMLGSHLDSVDNGPGINDNGSGSAAILEVALKMKDVQSNNKLRFAWWGAEELGLVGSTKYVEGLSDDEKSKVKVYLNFDMVGSPNFMLGVFDADGSKFGLKGPKGSNTIEKLFQMFFQSMGTQSVDVEFSGRSDYAAFAAAGIPVGGLFTGAEGLKSEEEAALYGGKAGEAYDPNYHAPGDDITNINLEALEINTDAIAFAALNYAHSIADIENEKAQPEVLKRALP